MADEPKSPEAQRFSFREMLKELERRELPLTVSEILRRFGRELPAEVRRRLLSTAGPGILEGSVLGELINERQLPPSTLNLLLFAQLLQQIGRPAEEWAQTLKSVKAARRLVEEPRRVVALITGDPTDQSDPVLFQNPNDGSSRVSVVVTEPTAQSLAHTCGGSWITPPIGRFPSPWWERAQMTVLLVSPDCAAAGRGAKTRHVDREWCGPGPTKTYKYTDLRSAEF